LIEFVRLHPLLKTLSLRWLNRFTSNFTEELAGNCPRLKKLHLSECNQLTDDVVRPISLLEELESVSIVRPNPNFSDLAVHSILVGSMLRIREVELKYCEKIGDGALMALAECPKLTDVSLDGCPLITMQGLCPLITKKRLEFISLSHCFEIGDECIVDIVTQCQHMSRLHINSLPKLSKEGVDAILLHCPQLTELDISWCRWVDDDVLESFLKQFKKLKKITMWGCSRVTVIGITLCSKANVDIIGRSL